jgi:hypothetical protein
MKPRSHRIDTLSKSRHPPHAVPHVLSTESTGHLALRVQKCHAIDGAPSVETTARITYSSATQFAATNFRSGLSRNTLSACREARDLKTR